MQREGFNGWVEKELMLAGGKSTDKEPLTLRRVNVKRGNGWDGLWVCSPDLDVLGWKGALRSRSGSEDAGLPWWLHGKESFQRQETWGLSLVGEDPTCPGAPKPMRRHQGACALEPGSCSSTVAPAFGATGEKPMQQGRPCTTKNKQREDAVHTWNLLGRQKGRINLTVCASDFS